MRAILCVLDSFGVGSAPDAPDFDRGANTFGHVVKACAEGAANRDGLRAGPIRIPNLVALGLGRLAEQSGGEHLPLTPQPWPEAKFGYATEVSRGKDTPSGHWEMMGLPVDFDWGYFPRENSFPAEITEALIAEANLPGLLGNQHASGTEIIARLGEEHIRTGKPILYTSGDSVLQIAAHETHFGLDRLCEVCAVARRLADPYTVGRVIARPFAGETEADFKRTGNRRDLPIPPHGPTLMSLTKDAGREVVAIGKVSDIFAGQGVTRNLNAPYNADVLDQLLASLKSTPDGGLIVANFNDFDTLYGHRRDVAGYAACLETFDTWLPRMRGAMMPGDVMIITADHGCDPTWGGTDHTREYTPILAFGPGVSGGDIGRRDTFADIGQSLMKHLGLTGLGFGTTFL